MSKKSLLRPKVVTEKQVVANQSNAKKSTGPSTDRGKQVSSQNNFKHGRYAQTQFEVMDTLGEDPAERTRILNSLLKGYPPEHDGQRMVIEDVATLRWRRGQLERSQSARMYERVQALEIQRRLMHLQINHDVADVSQAEVLEKGLRKIDDCPAKYEVLSDKLKILIEQAEQCDYSNVLPHLTAIYGKQASYRGATIFNQFVDLIQLQQEREAALKARRPWPPPGDPVWKDEEAPTAEDEPGYDPRLDLPNELLLANLNQELHDVTELYMLFMETHVFLPQNKRDAAIAPAAPTDWYLAREIWMVDRDIDAKPRLFMKMRVEDRKWRLIQQEDQQVGPNGARPAAKPGPSGAPAESDAEPEVAAVSPPPISEPGEATEAVEEPTSTSGSVGSCDGNQAGDSASDPKPAIAGPASDVPAPNPQAEGPDARSAVTTLPLLMLACILGFMLGMRTKSAAGTPPAQAEESTVGTPPLQAEPTAEPASETPHPNRQGVAVMSPPLTPRHGRKTCPAPQHKRSPAITTPVQSGALDVRESLGTPRPRPSAARPYPVDMPESAVRTPPLQPLIDDDFDRSEAIDLLKTKGRPLDRTHYEPISGSQG